MTDFSKQKTQVAYFWVWLERWYEFGRIDWVRELKYPEWTVKEVGRFLQY